MPQSGTQALVSHLVNTASSAERVIPFLGSGVSAMSGILMGQDFIDYLATTIFEAAHDPGGASLQKVHRLREGVWERHFSQTQVDEADGWIREQHGRILKRPDEAPDAQGTLAELAREVHLALEAQPADKRSSSLTSDYIVEEGIRSLRDWRRALHFLARLDTERNVTTLRKEPEQVVIDSFVKQLVEKRMPNLTHKMIAHMSLLQNARLILTTNFDDLLERCFRALQRTIRVVEIPIGAPLPPARSFDLGRTLLKLHGGLIQARADLTLDDAPSEPDLDAFLSYLTPGSILAPSRRNKRKVWLLVIGYSGSDRRMTDIIKAAIRCHEALHVVWVIHSHADRIIAEQVFHEESMRELLGDSEDDRIRLIECDRPDLALYEAYQRIAFTLPPGGLTYRFSYKLPPTAIESNHIVQTSIDAAQPAISDIAVKLHNHLVKDSTDQYTDEELGLILRRNGVQRSWSLIVGGSGAMRIAAGLFDIIERPKNKMWFEMQDYSCNGMLLLDCVRTLAIRAGVFQRDLIITPDVRLLAGDDTDLTRFQTRLNRLLHRVPIVPDDWILFFYARDPAGGSASWPGNSWGNSSFGIHEDEIFGRLLRALGRIGFRTVVVPSTPMRIERSAIKQGFVSHCLSWQSDIKDSKYTPLVASLAACLSNHPELRDSGAAQELSEQEEASKIAERILPQPPPAPSTSTLHTIRQIAQAPPKVPPERSLLFAGQADGDIVDSHGDPNGDRTRRRGGMRYEQHIAVAIAWTQKSGDQEYDSTVRRQKFLFAATLFRQSRHDSAFYSEAVFPCPYPFNVSGRDNDKARARLVDRWLRELESLRVITARTGGFFWMHRDVRLGLQAILGECRVPIDTPRRMEFREREMRARTHLWIARWYQRSFRASGHTVPLWACLHHNIECVIHAPDDRPRFEPEHKDALFRYRRHLMDLALRDCIRVLTLGRRLIKYWNTSADLQLFSQTKRLIESNEHGVMGALARLKASTSSHGKKSRVARHLDTLTTLVEMVIRDVESLNSSLAAECGKSPGQPTRQNVASTPAHGKTLSYTTRLGKASAPITLGCRWTFESNLFYDSDPKSIGFFEQFDKAITTLELNWVRDPVARRSLMIDLQQAESDHPLKKGRAKDLAGQSKWLDKHRSDPDRLLATVKLLNEMAYACARRAKTLEWFDEPSTTPKHRRTSIGKWLATSWLAHHALDLCWSLDPTQGREEALEAEKALTIYGLALGGLGRFSEAKRRLAEARTVLSMCHNEDRPRNGVIMLRLAEVHAFEASSWKESNDRQQFEASLSSAWLALEDAEGHLSGSSHSTLWWGLLYRLRLQVANRLSELNGLDTRRETDRHTQVSRSQLNDLAWTWTIAGLSAGGNSIYRRLRVASEFLRSPVLDQGLLGADLYEREKDSKFPIREVLDDASSSDTPDTIRQIAKQLRENYARWIKVNGSPDQETGREDAEESSPA